jgi:hypothetical protein
VLLHLTTTELAVEAVAVLSHTEVQAGCFLDAELVATLDVTIGGYDLTVIVALVALRAGDVPEHELVLAAVLLAEGGLG